MQLICALQSWPHAAIVSAVPALGAGFAIAAPVQAPASLTACVNNKNHKVGFSALGHSCMSGETTGGGNANFGREEGQKEDMGKWI